MTIKEFLNTIKEKNISVSCLDLKNEIDSKCKGLITFFSDEIENKQEQCKSFIFASNNIFDKKLHARKLKINEISLVVANQFFVEYHIQGKNNLGLIAFGLFDNDELVGVLSLGRHNRSGCYHMVVLDRLCFKSGIRINGGTSRLLSKAIEWAKTNKYEKIISFSDNRLTNGKVYESVGFTLDHEYPPDYCYVDENGNRLSKQSQKKSSSKCPENLTEKQWAESKGLRRIYDCGKKRWIININTENSQYKLAKSKKCAEQHKNGIFKHSHIRGYYQSQKNNSPIYYSSSYELRCMFLFESDPNILEYKRADVIEINGKSRNPDLFVKTKENITIYEIKPNKMLESESVIKQINDTKEYCLKMGYCLKVWTESDAGLTEKQIINWARKFIAETTGNISYIERRKELDRKKTRRFYEKHIKTNRVNVKCDFCKKLHNVLQVAYDNNIKNNGRFICIKENGHIVGSKNKKKTPPERKCNICNKVKKINEFYGKNDKYSYKCIECNKRLCKERYNKRKNKEN